MQMNKMNIYVCIYLMFHYNQPTHLAAHQSMLKESLMASFQHISGPSQDIQLQILQLLQLLSKHQLAHLPQMIV